MFNRILILIVLTHSVASADAAYSFGPMLHFYFSKDAPREVALGVEWAYWDLDEDALIRSFDIGVEGVGRYLVFYTELQWPLPVNFPTGISAGPLIAVAVDDFGKVKFGVQSSLWAAFFGGADFRYRFLDVNKYHAPGFFGKFVIGPEIAPD